MGVLIWKFPATKWALPRGGGAELHANVQAQSTEKVRRLKRLLRSFYFQKERCVGERTS